MGNFIDSWRSLSQWMYDNFGIKLQGEADKINGWKFSPQLQTIIDKAWASLEPAIQSALLAFVYQIYHSKGEATAENILSGILADLHITV
jgi:hypothetical protein